MRFKLIIGLGNPEKKYHHTYHNVGRQAVERLVSKKDPTATFQEKDMVCVAKIDNTLYAYPKTAMNNSGHAIKRCMDYFKIPPEETLVIHDDADLSIGTYKTSFARNAGGHHGIESTIEQMGTNEFWRFRIGIRPPQEEGSEREPALAFVLSPIKEQDEKILAEIFDQVAGFIESEIVKEIP